MAEFLFDATWVSKAFATSNPYIKYAIKIDTYEAAQFTQTEARTSEILASVYAFSDSEEYNQYEPNAYSCEVYLKIDDGSAEDYTSTGNNIQSGRVTSGKGGYISGGTSLYGDSNRRSISHELDGTKNLHVEAKVIISKNGDVIAESQYHGFYVKLKDIPNAMNTMISVYYVTEHSMALDVVLGGGNGVHSDPRGEPLPGDPHYYIFYYSIDNGTSWTYAGYNTIPRDEQGFVQTGYPELLIEMYGLEANTTYPVIIASRDLDEPPPLIIDDPSESPWAYVYSSKMDLTTLGEMPLPDIPSTRGFARRITLY